MSIRSNAGPLRLSYQVEVSVRVARLTMVRWVNVSVWYHFPAYASCIFLRTAIPSGAGPWPRATLGTSTNAISATSLARRMRQDRSVVSIRGI